MKKVGRPPATRGKRIIVSEGSGSEGSTEEPLCTFKSESSTTTESQTTESEEAVPIRSSRDTEKKAVTKAPPEKVPVIAPRPKGRPAADKQKATLKRPLELVSSDSDEKEPSSSSSELDEMEMDHSFSSSSSFSEEAPKKRGRPAGKGTTKPKQKVVQRKPPPQKKRRVNVHSSDDDNLTSSEDSEDQIETEQEEDSGPSIDVVLATKKNEKNENLFKIKLKNKSFRSATWMTEADLEKECGPKARPRLKKFLAKPIPEEEINRPEFSIAERVIAYDDEDDSSESESQSSEPQYYVKWKSLPYESCTWEDAPFVEKEYPELVAQLKKRNKLPSQDSIDMAVYHTERSIKDFDAKMESPKFNSAELSLREYQLEGFRWLVQCWYLSRNSILAGNKNKRKRTRKKT